MFSEVCGTECGVGSQSLMLELSAGLTGAGVGPELRAGHRLLAPPSSGPTFKAVT